MGWFSRLFSSGSVTDTLPLSSNESLGSESDEVSGEDLAEIRLLMAAIDKEFEGDDDFERDEDESYEDDYAAYRHDKDVEKEEKKFESLRDKFPELTCKQIASAVGVTVQEVQWKLQSMKANCADFDGQDTAEKIENSKAREKFQNLKPNLSSMTLSQIVVETGKTERTVISWIAREKLVCMDFDGSDPEVKRRYGSLQPAVICPHCQSKGTVRKMAGKGDVALNTKNLYRQKDVTKMHCDNCRMDWVI